MTGHRETRNCLILHIPHASRVIPPEERNGICLSASDLDQELLRVTDAWTDDLFPVTLHEAQRVIYPVSRLVCDPERFLQDDDEPMSRWGMGAVYTKTSHGVVMRGYLTLAERERIIDRWYRPHHEVLTHAVESALSRIGHALVVDCHSFPSRPLPYETDQAAERPDICLGTDSFHTPGELLHRAELASCAEGWTIRVNRPFSGALVPMRYLGKEKRLSAIMIEVNRGLYMDERSGERRSSFNGVRLGLGKMLETLADAQEPIGRRTGRCPNGWCRRIRSTSGAVNDTRDNETVAAIVGAVLSSPHGKSAIPHPGCEQLSGRTTDGDAGQMFKLLTRARRLRAPR